MLNYDWTDMEESYGWIDMRRGTQYDQTWNNGGTATFECLWNPTELPTRQLRYVLNIMAYVLSLNYG